MSKFSSSSSAAAAAKAPIAVASTEPTTTTYEGGPAWVLNPKSELFTLAVVNMVSEDTFYESGSKRDTRFVDLVHSVAMSDPSWVARLVPYLRNVAQMRSASVVVAAEYVRARHLAGSNWPADAPVASDVVASACARADEPAELLGYWTHTYPGEKIPSALLKGMAKAAGKLYNQFSALKWDKASPGIGMGNVIELAHPKPVDDLQSDLFKFILDRHHHKSDAVAPPASLDMVWKHRNLKEIPENQRRAFLETHGYQGLVEAGVTWEFLSSWLPANSDGVVMDAQAWESMIPHMGYMALMRNLRNFEKAGISKDAVAAVNERLADPEAVAKSRQFPYRFWSAIKNVTTNKFSAALDEALELSTANIPDFDGGTIVLVDVSGSMGAPVSRSSTIGMWEVAAVMAAAMSLHCERVKIVPFGTESALLNVGPSWSALKIVEEIQKVFSKGHLGYGTNIFDAVSNFYDGEKRVIVFTDMQTMDSYSRGLDKIPFLHFWDLSGHGRTPMRVGSGGRFQWAGFTDKMFANVNLIETVGHGTWPF